MITREDVVSILIPPQDMDLVRSNAKAAQIGGISQIRSRRDRQESLGEDQLVGQMTNYAGIYYLTDSIEPYREIREQANRNRFSGDDGIDIPNYRIDIKGSLMRGPTDPTRYCLPVRPKERHTDWAYVVALVRYITYHEVYLVGWMPDKELPEEPEPGGIFKGAYTVSKDRLQPMSTLKDRLPEFRITVLEPEVIV